MTPAGIAAKLTPAERQMIIHGKIIVPVWGVFGQRALGLETVILRSLNRKGLLGTPLGRAVREVLVLTQKGS